MTWPLLLMSIAGIILAVRNDRRALTLLLASIGFLAILIPVRFGRIHYLMPVALPLMLFVAYACIWAMKRTASIRVPVLGIALVGVGMLLLQNIDLAHAMVRDSRYAAALWMDEHVYPGDHVLHFGATLNLPPMGGDIEGIHVDRRAEARPALVRGLADFVVVVPDDTNEERRRVRWREGRHSVHSDYMRPEDFDALADGSLGYRLVAKFQTPRLMPWLPRPFLSYSSVNPPVHIFAREDRAAGMPRLEPWWTAPHYPTPRASYEPMPVSAAGVMP
jgi:hypothetical protein